MTSTQDKLYGGGGWSLAMDSASAVKLLMALFLWRRMNPRSC